MHGGFFKFRNLGEEMSFSGSIITSDEVIYENGSCQVIFGRKQQFFCLNSMPSLWRLFPMKGRHFLCQGEQTLRTRFIDWKQQFQVTFGHLSHVWLFQWHFPQNHPVTTPVPHLSSCFQNSKLLGIHRQLTGMRHCLLQTWLNLPLSCHVLLQIRLINGV